MYQATTFSRGIPSVHFEPVALAGRCTLPFPGGQHGKDQRGSREITFIGIRLPLPHVGRVGSQHRAGRQEKEQLRVCNGSLFPSLFSQTSGGAASAVQALRGLTDEDLADDLGISQSAVKKTWRTLYDREERGVSW